MRLLSLDASQRRATIALLDGETVIEHVLDGARHESALGEGARTLLAEGGLAVLDLDGVVVGVGPGSFTGIRIAVTFAKTLAYAIGCRLDGISSLAALARDGGDGLILAAEDAGYRGIYAGAWRVAGDVLTAELPVALYPADALVGSLAATPDRVVGSAVPLHRELFDGAGWGCGDDVRPISAASLAKVARAAIDGGRPADDALTLLPLYCLESPPEQKRDGDGAPHGPR